jgi:thiamine biosynthesis lipoprotein
MSRAATSPFILLLATLPLLAGAPGGYAPPASQDMQRRVWPVMGTILDVTIRDVDPVRARAGLDAARNAVAAIDSLMSTYIESSELSLINRRAGSGVASRVGPSTARVLESALTVGRLSGGMLDVTVGPLVDTWDFYVAWQGEEVEPPDEKRIRHARSLVGQNRIIFDREDRTILLPESGMQLDFGSLAKGFALDEATDELRRLGIREARLDLGGQIMFIEEEGVTDRLRRIGIRNPRDPGQLIGVVTVDGGSIATSGDYERYFTWKGARYFHILDPRTGWPATGTASVTVWAPTGMEADAWSTALFIAGPERGAQMMTDHRELGAVWILDPGDDPFGREHFRTAGALDGRVELRIPGPS